MSDDFLSRWSRRKLRSGAVASEAQTPETHIPEAQASQAPERNEPALAEAEPRDGEITPEELAALPALENLTAASDITGFLRKGVPLALRNDALRRMWALDPAIRDFAGDARDYAWDWNTPGGVPVSGPLPSTMNVEKMLQTIFGKAPETPAEAPEPVAGREDVIGRPADVATQEPLPPAPLRMADRADVPDLPQGQEAPDRPPSARPRRHGSALPS